MRLSFSININLKGKYHMMFSFKRRENMRIAMINLLLSTMGCSGVCGTDDCFILDASIFSGTSPKVQIL